MLYYHADVFCKEPMTGNGLTVFVAKAFPERAVMQQIAREFRQFETIFLVRRGEAFFDARIFTVEEELDFAGHPILGAAAVAQHEFLQEAPGTVLFNLNNKQVSVYCSAQDDFYDCCMDQGPAEFICAPEPEEYVQYLQPLNLTAQNLAAGFPGLRDIHFRFHRAAQGRAYRTRQRCQPPVVDAVALSHRAERCGAAKNHHHL